MSIPPDFVDHLHRIADSPPIGIQGPGVRWTARARAFLDYARGRLLDLHAGAPARAYLLSERYIHPDTWHAFQLGLNPTDLYDSPEKWGLHGEMKVYLPAGIKPPALQGGAEVPNRSEGSPRGNTPRDHGDKKVYLPAGILIPGLPDLAGLARYRRILACHDADPAGDRARLALAYPRIEHIPPPAHDLTDYHIREGDLEIWLA